MVLPFITVDRWPITEAMIAMITAYKMTGQRKFLNDFSRAFDYSMVHVRKLRAIYLEIIICRALIYS